ncbi:hypothetical protein [Alcanivorax sp. DG881]|jgi:hypothetical protein|uniref:hypothetical protein n=1 Tax=Alcanivorax sp. DG881 TaxID=236097 RepID=UPI0005870405|nr:hypothetical protein [Alcanivorax sp. DG881]
MSSKINIWSIVMGHVGTMKDASNGKVSIWDCITFFVFPASVGLGFAILDVIVTDGANSMLVNFGAIFTALLLSVLVLVYDQGEKLGEITNEGKSLQVGLKKELLEQLYYNICYSVVLSVFLVFLCLVYTFFPDEPFMVVFSDYVFELDAKRYFLSPLILMVVTNLLLTILMVVKRMHTLLTIKI